MDNLEKKAELSNNSVEEQGIFYKIVDRLMQFRKAITDSQPEIYRFIHCGELDL